MNKAQAIEFLTGEPPKPGSYTRAAEVVGLHPAAFRAWPDVLTAHMRDRVIAAVVRRKLQRDKFQGRYAHMVLLPYELGEYIMAMRDDKS